MSVYAVSDLHGSIDLFHKILAILTPDDILYCLGDVCDRGLYGYDMMKQILENPQIIYLKGNHEQMFVDAARQMNKNNLCEDYPETNDIDLHKCNGGKDTIHAWLKDNLPMDIIDKLDSLPEKAEYINKDGIKIVMTHSGGLEDRLWDRNHFTYPIKEKNTIIVHGHTPIPYLPFLKNEENLEAPYWYADNTKVDIDCGCFISDMIVLLNLDNFQAISITND